MPQNRYLAVAAGTVAVACAVPVVVSVASLLSFVWPVIPLVLTAGFVASKSNNRAENNEQ